MAIRDQDKKKVEKDFSLTEGVQKAIGQETMRNKAEPSIDTPQPVGIKDLFLYHDRLLASQADIHKGLAQSRSHLENTMPGSWLTCPVFTTTCPLNTS